MPKHLCMLPADCHYYYCDDVIIIIREKKLVGSIWEWKMADEEQKEIGWEYNEGESLKGGN